MTTDVDYYDVQRMIEEEARNRRADVDQLRALIELRSSEATEALHEEIRSLQRVLDARTGSRA